jgi:hypothetical protein
LDYDCKNPGGGGGWTLGSSPGVGGTRRPLQSGGPSAAAAVSTSGGVEASANSGAAAASVGGSVEASPGSGAVVASAGGGAEASPGGGAVAVFRVLTVQCILGARASRVREGVDVFYLFSTHFFLFFNPCNIPTSK